MKEGIGCLLVFTWSSAFFVFRLLDPPRNDDLIF